ncbi:MAG TPA: DUF2520 domain-containing protein [Sphingobacteriaceae bacterium]|nr:DUF2520 domain-containing protein [Sphingobacteriaceae bacterium]
MDIVLLGSGNVATHLGKALMLAGHNIIEVWSRTFQNAQILAVQLQSEAISEISQITKNGDIYIISVSDDAIRNVARLLHVQDKLIIHTSGSTELNVLKDFSSRVGVLYPLQTFSKFREMNFKNIPLIVEGSSDVVTENLKKMALQLSSKVYSLDSNQRQVLHISAVFACNFTNHLFVIAENLLEKHAIDFDMLRPLITETVEKIITNSPAKVQTGPAVRNDNITIEKHLVFLRNSPDLQAVYQLLSQSIVNLKNHT